MNLDILLLYFVDVPSAPAAPTIVNFDINYVDLSWSPPDSDGGAPIQQYIVEQKDKYSSNWVESLKVSADTLKVNT